MAFSSLSEIICSSSDDRGLMMSKGQPWHHFVNCMVIERATSGYRVIRMNLSIDRYYLNWSHPRFEARKLQRNAKKGNDRPRTTVGESRQSIAEPIVGLFNEERHCVVKSWVSHTTWSKKKCSCLVGAKFDGVEISSRATCRSFASPLKYWNDYKSFLAPVKKAKP